MAALQEETLNLPLALPFTVSSEHSSKASSARVIHRTPSLALLLACFLPYKVKCTMLPTLHWIRVNFLFIFRILWYSSWAFASYSLKITLSPRDELASRPDCDAQPLLPGLSPPLSLLWNSFPSSRLTDLLKMQICSCYFCLKLQGFRLLPGYLKKDQSLHSNFRCGQHGPAHSLVFSHPDPLWSVFHSSSLLIPACLKVLSKDVPLVRTLAPFLPHFLHFFYLFPQSVTA